MARQRVKPSEYGGDDGLVQPTSKGHVPGAREQAMIMRVRAVDDGQGGTRPVGGGAPDRATAEQWPDVEADRLA